MPKKGEYDPNASEDSKRQRRYNSSAAQKKRRAQRNAARREMEKEGKVRKGDGREVDHVKHKAKGSLNNDRSNLRVTDKKTNRAKNLGTGGRKPGKSRK